MNCSYALKVSLPVDINSPGNKVKKLKSYQWYRSTSFKLRAGLKQERNLSPLLANIFPPFAINEALVNRNQFVELEDSFQWFEETSYIFSKMLESNTFRKDLKRKLLRNAKQVLAFKFQLKCM